MTDFNVIPSFIAMGIIDEWNSRLQTFVDDKRMYKIEVIQSFQIKFQSNTNVSFVRTKWYNAYAYER